MVQESESKEGSESGSANVNEPLENRISVQMRLSPLSLIKGHKLKSVYVL